MTTFQLVALPLLAVFALFTVAAMWRRRLDPRPGLMWMLLWLLAALAIADPDLMVTVAHFLGIGRGADLVLYLSILFNFAVVFLFYLRFRRLDEQITTIVRHLAIRDAAHPERGEEA